MLFLAIYAIVQIVGHRLKVNDDMISGATFGIWFMLVIFILFA